VGTEDFCITPLRLADGIIVIQVSGEIDISSSLAFKERLLAALDESTRQVVLDLGAADRVDTTGMSVILELARRYDREDRELAIVCSEGWVRRALANTGMDQVVATHATLAEVLGHDKPAP